MRTDRRRAASLKRQRKRASENANSTKPSVAQRFQIYDYGGLRAPSQTDISNTIRVSFRCIIN